MLRYFLTLHSEWCGARRHPIDWVFYLLDDVCWLSRGLLRRILAKGVDPTSEASSVGQGDVVAGSVGGVIEVAESVRGSGVVAEETVEDPVVLGVGGSEECTPIATKHSSTRCTYSMFITKKLKLNLVLIFLVFMTNFTL